ncbi:MAG: tyrosine-type recombinase/integrase [Planctomycetota bacterium]
MSRSKSIPKLLTRKSPSTGRRLAYARFDGRVVSFGAMGPEAEQQFQQTLAEWLANGRRLPTDDGEEFTVADVIAEYLQHAEQEYREVEVDKLRRAFKPVLERFRSLPAAKFGVSCLEIVQHHLAHDLHERPARPRSKRGKTGAQKKPPAPPRRYHLSRATIRARINAIRRCWRWAEQRRLVPAGSWEHLRTLSHVKPGRTPAKETKIVDPVPWAWVKAVLPHLTGPIRACVLLQWWSGMRPSEALTMTGRQLQRTDTIWIYRPVQHKGVWRGRDRIVQLGPKAQAALRPRLKLDPDAAIIAPLDAFLEVKAKKRAERKSKVQPSQQARDERNANKAPPVGAFYDVNSYRTAIHRACDKAGVPRWSPHRLRHAAAARMFEAGEFEAARAVLGHSRLDMTRHYAASADRRLAADAMARLG